MATNPASVLTQTDIVVLRIYTYEMMVGKHVYATLNETLRSRGAERVAQLAPFKKYLWMLLKALSKVKPYQGHSTCYRALNVDISASCREGKVFTAYDMYSTSLKLAKCEAFLRGSGTKGTLLIFQLRAGGTRARDIQAFSIFNEEELLLPCGGRYRILGAPTDAGDFVIVQLEEIDPLERDAILGMNAAGIDAFLPLPLPPPPAPVALSVPVPNPVPVPAVDFTRAIEEAIARERQLAEEAIARERLLAEEAIARERQLAMYVPL